MSDPSENNDQVAKPSARGDTTAAPGRAGNSLQPSGHQKADEQAMRDASSTSGKAVRRRPANLPGDLKDDEIL